MRTPKKQKLPSLSVSLGEMIFINFVYFIECRKDKHSLKVYQNVFKKNKSSQSELKRLFRNK